MYINGLFKCVFIDFFILIFNYVFTIVINQLSKKKKKNLYLF